LLVVIGTALLCCINPSVGTMFLTVVVYTVLCISEIVVVLAMMTSTLELTPCLSHAGQCSFALIAHSMHG